MKRTYEVLRLDPTVGGLAVTIKVDDCGPCWKICVTIPWAEVLAPRIMQAIGGAEAALVARTISLVEQGLWE